MINPNDEKVWVHKGIALGRLGKSEEAIKCFDNAIEINPDYEEAWYNKGVALNYLGKSGEAIKCYNKALNIKRSD
ncbi:unnamed protein product [marine sediment metagenome]|uniref:Uncharacterized protein n=1 Tax=marine sediment metagenome TaxID=412755 RepID=X0SYR7_9ZZZZ